MRKFFTVLSLTIYFFFSTACSDKPQPVTADNGMVVSTSSYASKVGVEILKKGGNSIDAAVAIGFALAVAILLREISAKAVTVIHLADGKILLSTIVKKLSFAHRDVFKRSR
jgi:gamma-glutamyltranspeptidase/glutathione hydrolase